MELEHKKTRYLAGLSDFLRFGLGVNGSGGLASIFRIKASALFRASASGRKSSLANSAASSACDSCLRFVGLGFCVCMYESVRRG